MMKKSVQFNKECQFMVENKNLMSLLYLGSQTFTKEKKKRYKELRRCQKKKLKGSKHTQTTA